MPATHEVLNQPPELPEYDLYLADPILPGAVEREGAGWAADRLSDLGASVGTHEVREWGFQANRHGPVLHTHDRFGHRVDQVEFHPAWHSLMEMSVRHGVHSFAFEDGGPEGSFAARTALMYLDSQMEQGHGCPISMTSSVLPALRNQPEVAAAWEPRVLSRAYDPRFAPAGEKAGVLLGMGMTEKQGGSDVRSNTTRAVPENGGGPGGSYRLTGHKWFTSAPQCDAFLVLAQAPGGLSCFLLPRFTPDGEVNAFYIQRLKDKLGNRSNASSEVEYDGAWAVMVGEEGRGVPTIIEMVNGTRLDCTIGAAAIMRQAVTQAAHHVGHRSAFGDNLVDKPLMRAVIADLEVEAETATLLMMRVAGAFDRADGDVSEALLKRIITPVAKYWVSKRCTSVVHEALECLGGGGYVEDSMMPRLFRESPLNAIWEGSGNVIALDLVRAMVKEPKTVDAFLDEAEGARGADGRLDTALDGLRRSLASISDPERLARRLIEQMALVMEGSLAVRYGSPSLADAFCSTRLDGDWGHLFGTLPSGLDLDPLVEAAQVA
jgi:putative acyl-CoA dehydrogenase